MLHCSFSGSKPSSMTWRSSSSWDFFRANFVRSIATPSLCSQVADTCYSKDATRPSTGQFEAIWQHNKKGLEVWVKHFFLPHQKNILLAVPAPLNLFYVFSGDNVDQCLQKHLQWYLSPLLAFMVLDGISERFFLWQMFEDISCKCYCCRSDTASASSSAPAEQFGSNEVSLGLLLFSHKVGLLLSLPWNRSREVGTGC